MCVCVLHACGAATVNRSACMLAHAPAAPACCPVVATDLGLLAKRSLNGIRVTAITTAPARTASGCHASRAKPGLVPRQRITGGQAGISMVTARTPHRPLQISMTEAYSALWHTRHTRHARASTVNRECSSPAKLSGKWLARPACIVYMVHAKCNSPRLRQYALSHTHGWELDVTTTARLLLLSHAIPKTAQQCAWAFGLLGCNTRTFALPTLHYCY